MTIPMLVAIVGLLIWFVAAKTRVADPWAAEVGRLAFFAGLSVYLLTVAGVKVA